LGVPVGPLLLGGGGGGSLLLGSISCHSFLTLLLGARYFCRVATFGGSLLLGFRFSLT